MCNCGKRAAAATRQAEATPVNVQGRGLRRSVPEPVIHDPALWGPHMWSALHTLSLAVRFGSARAEWTELLTHLAASLPCPECAGHYATWLASHPLVQPRRRAGGAIFMMRLQRAAAPTSVDIAAWILDLHNAVNGRKAGADSLTAARLKGIGAWNMGDVTTTYGGDVGARRDAVRAAIEAMRGMIGARAIGSLEVLLGRM